MHFSIVCGHCFDSGEIHPNFDERHKATTGKTKKESAKSLLFALLVQNEKHQRNQQIRQTKIALFVYAIILLFDIVDDVADE